MTEATRPPMNAGDDHLDLILATSEIGIWELDVETGVAKRNLRHDQIFGYSKLLDIWSAEIFLDHVLEEDRDRIGNLLAESVNNKKSWEFQTRIRRADGALRWISAKGTPRFGSDGQIRNLIGHVIDISEHKETEDRLNLLTRELNHRVANTFTILTSIIRQSAKKTETVSEFADSLSQRLAALARANRVLTAQESQRSSLNDILEMEFAVFHGWRERVHVVGDPELWFSGEASEALSLIFHELLTNAVKYGALSNSAGNVRISIEREDSGRTLITWTERNGPPVPSNPTAGIGSTVLANALRTHGFAEIGYDKDGLTCRIVVHESFRRSVSGDAAGSTASTLEDDATKEDALAGLNVLVVEDDPIIGLDISDILTARGAVVTGPFTDQTPAMSAISTKIDVALLDVNLGDQTSNDVAEQLTNAQVPFLFLSGQLDRSVLHAEFQDAPFISKPFSDHDLVVGLLKLLRHSA